MNESSEIGIYFSNLLFILSLVFVGGGVVVVVVIVAHYTNDKAVVVYLRADLAVNTNMSDCFFLLLFGTVSRDYVARTTSVKHKSQIILAVSPNR